MDQVLLQQNMSGKFTGKIKEWQLSRTSVNHLLSSPVTTPVRSEFQAKKIVKCELGSIKKEL